MSRFTEAKRLNFITNVEQRMTQASQQLAGFNQSVLDVFANWQGYAALETDQDALLAAGLDFAAKSREMVDARKAGLAQALDIIAAGMVDAEGRPLTRQSLLNEIAAVQLG